MTWRLPAALALCATPAALFPAAKGDVRVELKSHAKPTTSVITVADVATVTADGPDDALAAARLARVPLAPAPPAGGSAVVTAAAVRARAEAGGFRVTLAGAESAAVRTPRRPAVSEVEPPKPTATDERWAEQFAAAAVARTLARYGGPIPSIEIALHADAARVLAAARPAGCDVAGLDPASLGPQTVKLRWLDDGDRVRSVPAAVRLSPRTAAAPPPPPTAPAAGAAANAPLAAEPRHTPAAPGPPLVRANQVVTVESSAGGVRVTRALKSSRSGKLGETVQLSVPGTRERVFARVVGNRRAVIVGGESAVAPYAAGPAGEDGE